MGFEPAYQETILWHEKFVLKVFGSWIDRFEMNQRIILLDRENGQAIGSCFEKINESNEPLETKEIEEKSKSSLKKLLELSCLTD